MSENQWQVVYEATDPVNAEILRGLLESQGIQVHLSQEGAGRAIGFTVGPLGFVQVLVPSDDFEKATELLAEYTDNQDEE